MKENEMKYSVQVNAEAIIGRRKLKCWSQARLAQVSGVGERSIQRIESQSKASYQNAMAIAGALEMPIEEVLIVNNEIENPWLYDLIINKKAKFYQQVTSGSDLMALIGRAKIYSFNEGHLTTEDEAKVVGSLFQEIRDHGDMISELEPFQRVEGALQFTKTIDELKSMGLLVFFHEGKATYKVKDKEDVIFEHLSILLVRKDAPEIIVNNVGKLLVAVVDPTIEKGVFHQG